MICLYCISLIIMPLLFFYSFLFGVKGVGAPACCLYSCKIAGKAQLSVFSLNPFTRSTTHCSVHKKRNYSWIFELEMGKRFIFNGTEKPSETELISAYLFLFVHPRELLSVVNWNL